MKRSIGRQRCFTSWKITTKLCGLALCVAAQSINQCSAQTMSIWTGASCAATAVGDCEWGTDDNWAPPPPDPAPHAPTKPPNDGTANIVFNGPVGLTPLLAGDWNVNSILFDVSAGAFVNAGAPNTLTIQNGITNNSLNPQTFVSTRISLGAPQTWAANQSNLLFKTGSTVANNGHTLTITGNSLTAIEYPMTGTGALVKNGTGTLELGANAAFNNNTVGPITINSGTVTIKGTQCVKKTPGVTLNGGILSLARPNSIGSAAATMTFNGGRLMANSQSDRYGTLILTANSVIDLDAVGGPSTLTFSGGSFVGGTLTVNDWLGTAGKGGTNDKIIMTNAPGAALLSAIRFTGFLTGAIYLAGTGEIVPGPRVLPTLSSPTRLSDTAFQFTVNGAAGERYAIQLSTLTNNWISIQIITAPSDSFDVVDPNATNSAAFYRVLVNQ